MSQRFEFAGYRLDRSRRELIAPNGAVLSLPAKAFEALAYFLEHPGEIIERRRLLDEVWPSSVVEENNLSQAVAAIRRTLGDGFIVTIPRQGYQFVADVTALASDVPRGTLDYEPSNSGAARASASRSGILRQLAYAAVALPGFVAILLVLDPAAPEDEAETRPSISASEAASTPQHQEEELPTESLEAYAEYLKAYSGSDALDPFVVTGMAHIERAIDIDPQFALAHAVRGRIHIVRAWLSAEWPGSPYETEHELALAREDALRSLAIDDDLGAGHGVLGVVESAAGRDREARARFERALVLSPNDNVIMYWYTAFLLSHGELMSALEVTERMRAHDSDTVTELMLLAGDVEAAAATFTAPVEPEDGSFPAHVLAGTGYLLTDRPGAAEREFRLAEAFLPPTPAEGAAPVDPWIANRFVPMLVYGFGRLGLQEDAERVFQAFEAMASVPGRERSTTSIYAFLGVGDLDEAYRIAHALVADPMPRWSTGQLSVVLNPLYDPTLDRPDFLALRRELGYKN